MGADAFSAWYGLRLEIDVEGMTDSGFDQVMEPFELGSEGRMVAARSVGLDAWTGRDTDGGTYYLAIGIPLGDLGGEHLFHLPISDSNLAEVQLHTRARLIKAGIEGTACLHLQFIGQY